MELSVDILQLTKELRAKRENVLSNQIGRSATSICANIAESKYAHGRADFIAKLEISLKKPMKQANGLKCFGKVIILMSKDIRHSIVNVRR
ncbi:MAG: four helix bundle protein [Clostridia bacterium]|nr:four helix bundle protein [Clostridia bacterium]